MSGLLSAIDDLAATDLDLLADCERGAELKELFAARSRLDAQINRRLGVFDRRGLCEADGAPSTQSWLRGHLRIAPNDASAEVQTARGLRDLPLVAAAWEAGEITRAHARAITQLAKETSLEATQDVEADLVDVARWADPLRFSLELRHWRESWRSKQPQPDDAERLARREVVLADSFDGMTSIKGWLTPEVAEQLRTVFAELAAPQAGETRTASQRHHDALGEACRRLLDADAVAPGHKVRPSLLMLCTAEGLLDAARAEAAQLGYGGMLSHAELQRLACDATVTRVLLSPAGEILDLGRATRTVTPAQWRALVVRDGGCVIPGCDRPATWCDVHHLIWWTRGGPTALDNFALVCGYHHSLIHEHSWTLGRAADQRWVFRRPDGSAVLDDIPAIHQRHDAGSSPHSHHPASQPAPRSCLFGRETWCCGEHSPFRDLRLWARDRDLARHQSAVRGSGVRRACESDGLRLCNRCFAAAGSLDPGLALGDRSLVLVGPRAPNHRCARG